MTFMRALLPEPQDEVDVHSYYAHAWLEHPGIRANMIASMDGAAAAQGLSRGLQTPGDNRIFAALRDLADVVLVGSATALAENYRPARLDEQRLAHRAAYGLRPELPIALISRSLRVDLTAPLFADPARRPLVITCGTADRPDVREVADVLVCGDHDIDYGQLRRELAARGLTRILCEGGPTVLAAMLRVGAVDELCLSLSPLLVGPGPMRITTGAPWVAGPVDLALTGLLEEDGALFLRLGATEAGGKAPTSTP
jgi:riboflavin biosynthesis pyrimidine reductase